MWLVDQQTVHKTGAIGSTRLEKNMTSHQLNSKESVMPKGLVIFLDKKMPNTVRKGGLISISFSLWLKSPKKGCHITALDNF